MLLSNADLTDSLRENADKNRFFLLYFLLGRRSRDFGRGPVIISKLKTKKITRNFFDFRMFAVLNARTYDLKKTLCPCGMVAVLETTATLLQRRTPNLRGFYNS